MTLRLKLDENLGLRSYQALVALGYDVHSVHDEGLRGAIDERVLGAAFAEARLLVTQDRDFADFVRSAAPNGGVFWIRLPARQQRNLPEYLSSWFRNPDVAARRAGQFVIARGLDRVRVR